MRNHGGPAAAFNDLRALLEFEQKWPAPGGKKENAILRTFNVTPARYQQRLAQQLLTREALEVDAALVKRLLRQGEERAAARAERLRSQREVLR